MKKIYHFFYVTKYLYNFKKVGDFFWMFWPSHNVWTLKRIQIRLRKDFQPFVKKTFFPPHPHIHERTFLVVIYAEKYDVMGATTLRILVLVVFKLSLNHKLWVMKNIWKTDTYTLKRAFHKIFVLFVICFVH